MSSPRLEKRTPQAFRRSDADPGRELGGTGGGGGDSTGTTTGPGTGAETGATTGATTGDRALFLLLAAGGGTADDRMALAIGGMGADLGTGDDRGRGAAAGTVVVGVPVIQS